MGKKKSAKPKGSKKAKGKTAVKKGQSTLMNGIEKFSKQLGLKLPDMLKRGETADGLADLLVEVLAAINKEYTGQQDKLPKKKFAEWKEENQDMIDWYMGLYKDYKFPKTTPGPSKLKGPKVPKVKIKKKDKSSKKEKAKTGKAKTKKDDTPKKEREISCYGHAKLSQRGIIDEAVAKGTKRKVIIARLVKDFDVTEKRANQKLKRHLLLLEADKNLKITETKGVLKAK